jgi:hypothetical protein
MIFAKSKNKCIYCGEDADCIDHVYPVVRGGRTIESNLVASCTICNGIASGNAFQSFEEKQKYILKRREIMQPAYPDEIEEFQRPAWHAHVYGGLKGKRR